MYDITHDHIDLTSWLNYTLVNEPHANQQAMLIPNSLIWEPKSK